MPKHLVDAPADGKKRGRGRPPKKLEKPAAERYPSAIACHLAENDECRTNYSVQQFSVLARGRSRQTPGCVGGSLHSATETGAM